MKEAQKIVESLKLMEIPSIFGVKLDEFEKILANDEKLGYQIIYGFRGWLKDIKLSLPNNIDKLTDNTAKMFHENGNLLGIDEVTNGIKNGSSKRYYLNGNIEKECFYVNNLLDGDYKEYYENGNIKVHGFYKNGKLKGFYKSYHENGILIFEGDSDDISDASYKTYHKNGKLSTEKTILSDTNGVKKVNTLFYFDNGNKESDTLFNGKVPVYIKKYNKNGTIKSIRNYNENNLLDGLFSNYDEDGVLIQEATFKNGKLI